MKLNYRFVLDGWPLTKSQVALLTKFHLIPVCIVELEVSNQEVLRRAAIDRKSPDRLANELHASLLFINLHCVQDTPSSWQWLHLACEIQSLSEKSWTCEDLVHKWIWQLAYSWWGGFVLVGVGYVKKVCTIHSSTDSTVSIPNFIWWEDSL